jgi:hypothetical protein
MENRKAFLLRMSAELWTELERWAQDELRSVNGQIEYVLRQAVLRRKQSDTAAARPPATEEPPASGSPASGSS